MAVLFYLPRLFTLYHVENREKGVCICSKNNGV
ncbi:MAG: hypothetical protein Q9M89_01355 [Persephonella sp.]|nr:hypothetical protein [Persephonella sp.]